MTAWFDPAKAGAKAVQSELPWQGPQIYAPHPGILAAKQMRGRTAYLSGLAAEEVVTRLYTDQGMTVMAQRWRGSRAEIDLILRDGPTVVFVEVKKSRSFDSALMSLGQAQRRRIVQAAGEFLGSRALDQMTDMRFDLAMMNRNGEVEIVENAFCEDD